MLHDSQTDLVFLPMAIRYHFPKLYKSLTEAFMIAHVKCWEIPFTASKTRLWVRDWMPITVDKKGDLAQFRYDPDYLRAPRYQKYRPDMVPIWEDMEMTPFRYEDVVLDGGNVLADKQGHVYMTDKIFLENPHIPQKQFIPYLKEILNARSIKIVHWDKSDIYGHVDGMMAIADDGSLITDLSWEYLNFLRVGNKIFMAQLGKPTDEPALKRIQEAFPDCFVFPIQHAQCLTRLGGGLHCATWNTVERGYHNARYFIPSKRHPFNPFTEDAFSDERLRAVIEYYQKRQLQELEWQDFNEGFRNYWTYLWQQNEQFSCMDMVDYIKGYLEIVESQYFHDIEELKSVCNDLTSYLMHVPKAILPDNSIWNPSEPYISPKRLLVYFKDTAAFIDSFSVSFAHDEMEALDEFDFTQKIEEEARAAEERKDGTVYVLYYRQCDKRRVCPYRYTFTASVNERKHIRVVMFWDSPMNDKTILFYADKAMSTVKFYDHYREDNDFPF